MQLQGKCLVSTSKTGNKSIPKSRTYKKISNKSSYIEAIKVFNGLDEQLKTLNTNNIKIVKNRIKKELIKPNM